MVKRATYNKPTIKILVTPIFFLVFMRRFQITGTGINITIISVKISVDAKTVSTSKLLMH